MAIVIEEDRPRTNPLALVGWVVILVVIVVAVYYIFFKSPESIITETPAGFRDTEQISKFSLDPESIKTYPGFRSRIPYVNEPVPQNVGRSNPFLPL